MSQPILRALRRRATQKGISEAALATMLLEIIVEDDLYEAVLNLDQTRESKVKGGTAGRLP